MSLRFFRRIRIAPGVTINLSKRGASMSLGRRGMRYTVGPTGTRGTVGVPGTGLRYTQHQGWGGKKARRGRPRGAVSEPAPQVSMEDRLTMGFFNRLFAPAGEKAFVDGLKEIHRGHTRKGEELLRPYVKSVPDAAFLCGFIALKRRSGADAAACFEHALRGVRKLGAMFRKYGLEMQLELWVTEHIQVMVQPRKRGVLLGLVEAYQLERRWDDAARRLEELLRGNPGDDVCLLSWCELMLEEMAGGRDAAEAVVRRTARIGNEDEIHGAIRLYRARALRALGMTTAARDVLTQTLRRRKGRPEDLLKALRYERVLVYTDLGHEGRVRKDLERLYAVDPDYRDVRKRLGL